MYWKKSFILVILMFFAVISNVFSQVENEINHPDIDIKVYVGFESYYRYQQWSVVNIVIKNDGAYFKGELELRVRDYSHNNKSIKRAVELPSSTLKKFQLYLSPSSSYYYGDDLIVKLLNNHGKTIASSIQEIKQIDHSQGLMLVLSKNTHELNYLSGTQTHIWGGSDLMVIYPPSENLPGNWIGYEGVDLIVLNNFSLTDELDGPQREAIENWVKAGGKLLVSASGDPLQFSGTFIEDILPVLPKDNIVVSNMKCLENYTENPIKVISPGVSIVSSNVKKEDTEVILDQEGIPFIAASHYGAGSVYFMAFDITKEPFKNWDHKLLFWEKFLSEVYSSAIFCPPVSDYDGTRILFDIPTLKPPSFKFIGLLLFVYILLVGPVNYWILKKWDKREFAVITIPVLVMFFSFGTYIMGYSSKGGDIRLTQASIINVKEESSFGETFISLFSPSKTDYKMEFCSKNTVCDTASTNNEMWNDILIREEEFFSLENINLNMWSVMVSKAWSVKDLSGKITLCDVDFKMKNGFLAELNGTILNETGLVIEDCCIIYNSSQIGFMGDVKKGKTPVQISFPENQPGGHSFMAKEWKRKAGFDEEEVEDKIMSNLTDKVMEYIYNGGHKGNLMLCGWNREPYIDVKLSHNAQRDYINLLMINLLEGDIEDIK